MMASSVLQKIIAPAIIIAGFAMVIPLSGILANIRPPLPEGYEDYDLSVHGSRLKGFAFGMEGLLADWYYMRSLQYIGDKVINAKSETINIEDLRDLNPRLLYPLLANATDLDPHFIAAYSYGALILPAIDPNKAIELASKGIANNPEQWRLYQYLGYIYWKLGRYTEAAEIYEKGSQVAGAAPFMKLMAASMKNEGGSRETARAIYREMLASSEDDRVRDTATLRLKELDSMDERDAIDHALAEFKEQSGHCAANFAEILPSLITVKMPGNHDLHVDNANRPVDPTGAPYILDKENCRAQLDPVQTKLPLK